MFRFEVLVVYQYYFFEKPTRVCVFVCLSLAVQGNADVNVSRRNIDTVPPAEMESEQEHGAYAERMLRFRKNPLRRMVEGRPPAIFTSTNQRMSGLGYEQYTHAQHEKPVLLEKSERDVE